MTYIFEEMVLVYHLEWSQVTGDQLEKSNILYRIFSDMKERKNVSQLQ